MVRSGKPVAISPKAYNLLEVLIESRPKAISKAEIRDRLWPGVHVAEANLPNLVVELRGALGDDARRPRIIRTVPRFGYSFLAPARTERSPHVEAPSRSGLVYRVVWGRREITLEDGGNLIGRDREAIVWIDDESVSRRHARISVDPDGASIEDLGSKNGTYVDGRKIRGVVPLAARDSVRIGPATLLLRVVRHTGSTRSKRTKGAR
ncbi:MAG TPA: FHA domain-containing protein [Thermoanaerobaculia bacterium]|nr:FHA domain-containing protein [Thermoanaerobaculia bacterium]